MINRNQEGYMYKTVRKTIRQTDKKSKKRKKKLWSEHLTYYIAEVPEVIEIMNVLQR